MTLAIIAIICGVILLVWSADKFVEGSASTARYFGMPPLLIGMVVVGFGTSAPEMVVSALASLQGNPGIAIGNAYGSNIANIGLILGITALISPIVIHSNILRIELPILAGVTALSIFLIYDLEISFLDAIILLIVFGGLMYWTIRQRIKEKQDPLAKEIEEETVTHSMPIKKSVFWLVVGLILLIVSSRILVWGAVELATIFGVSDMIIGLTIVAVGTSLPELASSIIAVRKGEHEIALGNILGSNLFNTLAVVGIAGAITPINVTPETLSRDIVIMAGLTLFLFVIGYGFKTKHGRINRIEGAGLLLFYIAYTTYLISMTFAAR
ncbi:MAG: calcium/sodium antiporter [Melioribacteraceae bacterium]|nr:calcium/sodium antiporter [Melioribacteraceae bacterium]